MVAQLDKAMKKIAELKDQSEARENTILLSAPVESDETIKPVSSIASSTISYAHTDVSEKVSKSEI